MTDGEIPIAVPPGVPEPTAAADCRDRDDGAEQAGMRRRLWHDIQHELATISLLAFLIARSDDIGKSGRTRATQLVRETHWLAELQRAYDDVQADPAQPVWTPPTERIRLDVLAGEVVAALRLIHPTELCFEPSEAWTTGNRLALWRALRNVLENAFRAAPQGQVRLRVGTEAGSAVVQVDDDGPGFGAAPGGLACLGLSIVRDVVAASGGALSMASSDLGGCRVRMLLPSASEPSDLIDGWHQEDRSARTSL